MGTLDRNGLTENIPSTQTPILQPFRKVFPNSYQSHTQNTVKHLGWGFLQKQKPLTTPS